MAIGQIRLGQTGGQQYFKPTINPRAFGGQVGTALKQVAASITSYTDQQLEIEAALADRELKREEFRVGTEYQEWLGQQQLQQRERITQMPADGANFTTSSQEVMQKGWEEFKAGIPERLLPMYEERHQRWMNGQTVEAFTFEFSASNKYDRSVLEKDLNRLAEGIYLNNIDSEQAQQEMEERINLTGLTEAEKLETLEQSKAFLQEADFRRETKAVLASNNYLSALPPAYKNLAIAIAADESNGKWNIRYSAEGGATFDDFSDHPNIPELITFGPHKGEYSTAAGAFQFTYSTWKEAQKALGLPDFSPPNQVRAMFWLAEKEYNSEKPAGLSLKEVLASGDKDLMLTIKSSLANRWQAFTTMSDSRFLALISGQADSDILASETPSIFGGEKYASLDFSKKLALFEEANTDLTQQMQAEQKALKAQLDEQRNAANMAALMGEMNEKDLPELVQMGVISTAEQVATFRKNINTYDTGLAIDREVQTAMVSGTGTLNKARHNDGLNRMLGDVVTPLGQLDSGFVAGQVLPVVDRAGFLPSDTANQLAAMATSGDMESRIWAMDTLGTIHLRNPNALAASDGVSKLIDDVQAYNAGKQFYTSPQELLQTLDQRKQPEFAAILEHREGEVETLLFGDSRNSPAYDLDSITSLMDNTWFDGDTAPPKSPQQQVALSADFNQAFREGYLIYGEQEPAEEFTKQALQKTWGTTDLGGSTRLMKYPPEKYYPDTEVVDLMIREEMVNQGIPVDYDYELIPTAETAFYGDMWRAAPDKAGHNAPYQIMVYDVDGNVHSLLNDAGQAWVFDGGVTGTGQDTVSQDYPEDYQDFVENKVLIANQKARIAELERRLDLANPEMHVPGIREEVQAEMVLEQKRLDALIATQQVKQAVGLDDTEAFKQLSTEEMWKKLRKYGQSLGDPLAMGNDPTWKTLFAIYDEKRKAEAE